MAAIRFLLVFILAGLALGCPGQGDHTPPYRDPNVPVERRVKDLLSRMTLEEKFWQLYMIPGDLDDPALDYSHGIFGLQIGTARSAAPGTATPPARSACRARRRATPRCRRTATHACRRASGCATCSRA